MPHWIETARLQPRRAAAWSNLGTVLAREGKLVDAVRAFERAVELEPRNPLLLANLAYVQRTAGNWKEALENFRKASSLGPPDRFTYSGTLGRLLLKASRPAEALTWLRRSRPGEVGFAEARFELAVLEFRAGNQSAAKLALEEALAAKPKLRARAEANSALAPLLSP